MRKDAVKETEGLLCQETKERREISRIHCRGCSFKNKKPYPSRSVDSNVVSFSIWPLFTGNLDKGILGNGTLGNEVKSMDDKGFLPPLVKNDKKNLGDDFREIFIPDPTPPHDFQQSQPLPSIGKVPEVVPMPKRNFFPPKNSVRYRHSVDYNDVKRNLETKSLNNGFYTDRRSFTFKSSTSPADRSMAFDVIKDTLQSEGIDENVSRQLAELAHKRLDDVIQKGHGQRQRKKRNLSRTPENGSSTPTKAPSTSEPQQTEQQRTATISTPSDLSNLDQQRRLRQSSGGQRSESDVRKRSRTERSKTVGPPVIPRESGGVIDAVTGFWFLTEADRRVWHKLRQQEVDLGPDYIPPRIVLISSKLKRKESFIEALSKDQSLITIEYDFDKATFYEIIENIKSALAEYRSGSKAKSVLLYCQGGPGYIYLLKGKVLTPQKLRKRDSQEMRWFFDELGCLVSKLEPEKSSVHILGCSFLGNGQGYKVLEELCRIMMPNQITFEAPQEQSPEERRIIGQYFIHKRYHHWLEMVDDPDASIFRQISCRMPEIR